MTLTEWLHCPDPGMMLHAIRGQSGDRTLRLFACACVREVWGMLEEHCRRAVEVAEQHARDEIGTAELKRAYAEADPAVLGASCAARFAARATAKGNAWEAAWDASWEAALVIARAGCKEDRGDPFNSARAHQAALLRLLIEPVPRPVLDPSWLRWNDGGVVKIARMIRDEGRYEDLPILADALMDAGCDNEALLVCRAPAKHLRDCWVVDLLLGKN
jgi:hypothetical protein